METILKAAGAEEVMTINRYAHLVGGARMAARAEDGVVDSDHRVFGVPKLYIVDGSALPTQGSANPALTIMALAARAAARLIALGRRGLAEQQLRRHERSRRRRLATDHEHRLPPSLGSPHRNPKPTAPSTGMRRPPSP